MNADALDISEDERSYSISLTKDEIIKLIEELRSAAFAVDLRRGDRNAE